MDNNNNNTKYGIVASGGIGTNGEFFFFFSCQLVCGARICVVFVVFANIFGFLASNDTKKLEFLDWKDDDLRNANLGIIFSELIAPEIRAVLPHFRYGVLKLTLHKTYNEATDASDEKSHFGKLYNAPVLTTNKKPRILLSKADIPTITNFSEILKINAATYFNNNVNATPLVIQYKDHIWMAINGEKPGGTANVVFLLIDTGSPYNFLCKDTLSNIMSVGKVNNLENNMSQTMKEKYTKCHYFPFLSKATQAGRKPQRFRFYCSEWYDNGGNDFLHNINVCGLPMFEKFLQFIFKNQKLTSARFIQNIFKGKYELKKAKQKRRELKSQSIAKKNIKIKKISSKHSKKQLKLKKKIQSSNKK